MAAIGCTVRAFDPASTQPDTVNHKNIHFYKIGIGHKTGKQKVNNIFVLFKNSTADRRPKVTILLWKVPQEIKLAGAPEPAKIREEPARVEAAKVEPTRVEGDLPCRVEPARVEPARVEGNMPIY